MPLAALAQNVVTLWFGELNAAGFADDVHQKRWWMKDDTFDRELTDSYAELHREIAAGQHEDWLETPRGTLAYVIVLDQFSRNMFRGTEQMYAGDARVLKAVYGAMERGFDEKLGGSERTFLYMPLMHSESLVDQERCLAEFKRLALEVDPAYKAKILYNAEYAEQHRVIVERFGRFPHRNEILGRPSTPEEVAFLKEPGSSF